MDNPIGDGVDAGTDGIDGIDGTDGTDGTDDTLGAIREIASLINASNDYHGLLDRIVDAVCRHLKWSRCAILVIDRSKALSQSVAFRDLHYAQTTDPVMSWDLSTSPALRVLESRSPLVLADAPNDERFPSFRDFAGRYRLKTVVMLPLSATDLDGREMVLNVGLRDDLAVAEDDLDHLRTICHLVSIAVDKFKLFRAEQTANEGLRDLFDSNSRLMERIIAGCNMDEVVELIAVRLKQPFAIYDRISDAFLWSGCPEPLASLDEDERTAVTGSLGDELRQALEGNVGADPDRTIRLALDGGGHRHEVDAVVAPLLVNTQMMGGLVLFPKTAGMSDIERLVVQGAQFAISTHLMRTYASWTEKSTAASAFFGHLFDGDWQSMHQVEAMADSVGIDFAAAAQFLAVDLSAVAQESTMLQRSIEMSARQIIPSAVVFLNNHTLFIYHPAPERGAEKIVQRLAEEVGRQVEWRTGHAVGMTVSPVCTTPADFRSVRSRCLQVLRLSRLFRRAGLVRSDDFGSFAVLVSALGDDAVAQYLDDTLQPIMDYDRAKKSALLACAEAFLNEGCRYQAAADTLGIHVSTLRYRLKRLNELFAMDIENSEDARFALSLALKIQRLRI